MQSLLLYFVYYFHRLIWWRCYKIIPFSVIWLCLCFFAFFAIKFIYPLVNSVVFATLPFSYIPEVVVVFVVMCRFVHFAPTEYLFWITNIWAIFDGYFWQCRPSQKVTCVCISCVLSACCYCLKKDDDGNLCCLAITSVALI